MSPDNTYTITATNDGRPTSGREVRLSTGGRPMDALMAKLAGKRRAATKGAFGGAPARARKRPGYVDTVS